MYIERKQKGDPFWILRFLDDNEKQEFVRSISNAINGCIKEEYREEYNESLIKTFNKAQHKERYDENDEESVIISSSQIANLLQYLLELCVILSEFLDEYDELTKKLIELTDLTEDGD